MTFKPKTIDTIQWNVRNIKKQRDGLGAIVDSLEPQVLLLQSLGPVTKKDRNILDLPGYNLVCYDSRVGGRKIDTGML